MNAKLTWKKSIDIPDGTHTGEIVDIFMRYEPYEYTDIVIKLDGFDFDLKYGCPSILSENSKLGKLMLAFGETFEVDKEVDIDATLMHKRVSFMVLKQKGKDGKEYSNIVEGSIKPETQEVKPQQFQPPDS